MNLVIIGAGDLGMHLATIFSGLSYGIVLIDKEAYKLERAARELDVATRLGSGTDWELLESLKEFSPDMLIALTDDDEVNLVACTLAKNLGYPQTVARVRSDKYFTQNRLNFEKLFSVDHLIGPEKLTADAIANMILIPGSLATEMFAHGSIILRVIKVPPNWKKGNIPLSDTKELELPTDLICGLIRRFEIPEGKADLQRERIIFPHGSDTLLPNDEVTFIGESEAVRKLHKFFGMSLKIPKSVVIIGGSLIGIYLAKILAEHHIHIRIIEKDFSKCVQLSEKLPNSTVIHRDGTDIRFLLSEKIGDADAVVACTRSDEVNFLAGAIAKELGCENVIISLSDTNYFPIVDRLNITHAASPRIHTANRILTIAREKNVASMVSMYENQAEIMEVKVSKDSKVAGVPIKNLADRLPHDFLIVMIQSQGKIFLADGSRVLSPGDTAVVINHPRHLNEVKKLF